MDKFNEVFRKKGKNTKYKIFFRRLLARVNATEILVDGYQLYSKYPQKYSKITNHISI